MQHNKIKHNTTKYNTMKYNTTRYNNKIQRKTAKIHNISKSNARQYVFLSFIFFLEFYLLRMKSLREVCLRCIALHHQAFESFRYLPSPLLSPLFELMREQGSITCPSQSTLEKSTPTTTTTTTPPAQRWRSPLKLFQGSSLPSISLASFSSSHCCYNLGPNPTPPQQLLNCVYHLFLFLFYLLLCFLIIFMFCLCLYFLFLFLFFLLGKSSFWQGPPQSFESAFPNVSLSRFLNDSFFFLEKQEHEVEHEEDDKKDGLGITKEDFPDLEELEILFCDNITPSIINWRNPPALTSLSFFGCAAINDSLIGIFFSFSLFFFFLLFFLSFSFLFSLSLY